MKNTLLEMDNNFEVNKKTEQYNKQMTKNNKYVKQEAKDWK